MTSVDIRDLEGHLRQYLDAVEKGEEVVVTDGGRPVARIVKEPSTAPNRRWLEEAAARGEVRLATGKLWSKPPLLKVPGKPLSEVIIEDRG